MKRLKDKFCRLDWFMADRFWPDHDEGFLSRLELNIDKVRGHR